MLCVNILPVCMYLKYYVCMCIICVPDTYGSQKMTSDLELALQMVIIHHRGGGN